MKVLYITNNQGLSMTEAIPWFQAYCERENDLFLYSDLIGAKEFLSEKVIGKQKHLDFIITDWIFGFQNVSTLLNWLKESNEIYSTHNFQFRSIPILLIEDVTSQSSSISEGFDGVVKDFPSNYLSLRLEVKTAIKTWRYSLANDLDLIGLVSRQINYET